MTTHFFNTEDALVTRYKRRRDKGDNLFFYCTFYLSYKN